MRNSLSAALLVSMMFLSGKVLAMPMDFDFSGTFTTDDQIVLLDFTLATDSTITIFSSSWLAHENGAGFDPILAIWGSAGSLVQEQDDGENTGSTLSNGVLYNHGVWDSYFIIDLAAGSYQASIGQFSNFATGGLLSDGFLHDGNPNFTFDLGYGT